MTTTNNLNKKGAKEYIQGIFIREIQNNMTKKYYHIPIRMATIKTQTHKVGEYAEKFSPFVACGTTENGTTTVENGLVVLKYY